MTGAKHQRMLEDLLENCRKNLAKVNEDLIKKAFELSFEAHKNDFRASGEPYFNHPYAVATILAREIPLDDVSVVAALLHDVVEDADFSIEIIKKEFGVEAAEIVDGVTKISGVFKGQEITQAENYRKLLLSMVKDLRVILVKFSDRLHNMRTLEFVHPDKQRRIAKETLDIYAPFAHRFGLAQIKWELEDLAFKYLNKESYDELAQKLNSKRKDREAYINRFIAPIVEKLKEHKVGFDISGRPKHLYSIYRKMIKRNKPFEEIYDLFAVRIILESDDSNECYYTLGVINNIYTPVPDRFKDYVSIPKTNNYQSIHTTVVGPEGRLVEVQIRTRKMHEIAEMGVAAHWKYKENKTTSDAELENWVNWVREVFENASKDEASKELLASFKLNLYQDEIYVFTPKGDLLRLPAKSTPVDFAFAIHSKVGHHCIGAKINGKIVPLDSELHSGDQLDIITSKNQHPNRNWLLFAKTHKAKSAIRKWINKEDDRLINIGRSTLEKKIRKMKLNFSHEDIQRLSRSQKYDNLSMFYKDIAQNVLNLDEILMPQEHHDKHKESELEFGRFASFARQDAGGVLIDGKKENLLYNFAKCCNPIPGDPIVGYITIGEGVKIHRRTCADLINIVKKGENRLTPVDWPETNGSFFVGAVSISGEDAPGMLKEVTHNISTFQNTNIKGVNINSNGGMFKGVITVLVKDIEHLTKIIDRLKKIRGIFSVERFDTVN